MLSRYFARSCLRQHALRSCLSASFSRGTSDLELLSDDIAYFAATYDIELVVMSIGGNDLGFADIITACAAAWSLNQSPCNTGQQSLFDDPGTRIL